MKKIILCLACVAGLTSLQGCFWHSSEVEHTVPASGSSTTVVSPGTSSTVTTAP